MMVSLYATGTATATTWAGWNLAYSSTYTDTVTLTASDLVWTGWNTAWDIGSATGDSTLVWTSWNNEYLQVYPGEFTLRNVEETAEEKAARELKAAEEKERKAAIEMKAAAWLRDHLNPSQREQYEKEKQFTVYSKDSKRTYLITRENAWVYELNAKGERIRSFCIHSRTGAKPLPLEDEIAVKKILLENDEKEFLRIANATQLRAA